jgi:CarD family transcriptional regulator
MQLSVGQKVAYPNQGVCVVEEIKKRLFGERTISGYCLRVLGDNSTIFVPTDNAENVGIRPLISTAQCKKLVRELSNDFEPACGDWKLRAKQFAEKLHSGCIFEAADVFKKLTYLSFEKKLSFREQTMLEKAKYLVVSEITNADRREYGWLEGEICSLVQRACAKHKQITTSTFSATVH